MKNLAIVDLSAFDPEIFPGYLIWVGGYSDCANGLLVLFVLVFYLYVVY